MYFPISPYSPSGKLVQIEYALAAVAAGAPAVGIKAKDGVVLATEKKHKSILVEEHSIIKVEVVTDHIGMVYSGEFPLLRIYINLTYSLIEQAIQTSEKFILCWWVKHILLFVTVQSCYFYPCLVGMGPDYRVLVKQARKVAQQYSRQYQEPIPTTQLVQRLAAIMQEYTQSGWVTTTNLWLNKTWSLFF